MKQFHVYGIGNALVDIDFEVSDNTLQRLNVDKGVMTLIDEETHHYLLQKLDGTKHLKACGGSAANTIFTLQQLGAQTFYSCKVGNDESGDFFYRDLISNGIQTNLTDADRDGVTGKCIVLVTPDADRTMNTFLGTTADFSVAQLSEKDLINSEYLYIEGYLVASPTGREAAIKAREVAEQNGVKIAMSLSDPNMVTYFKEGLLAMIGNKLDILFCNGDEARLFANTDDLVEASEYLTHYARSFVMTLGGDGALIYDGREFSTCAPYKVKVVDTVGAGDIFAGSFLYGLTHGYGYAKAGDLASFAAAKVVAKFGPRLNQQEIAAIKNKTMPCTTTVDHV